MHSEMIGELAGSTSFVVQSFNKVNPGNVNLFPWLYCIAGRYESYVFRRLRFYYIPVAGSSERGQVNISFDSDAADAQPSDIEAMSQYSQFASNKPWTSVVLDIPPKVMHKIGPERYTRLDNSALGDPVYDCGTVAFATGYCADTSILGHIYVDYTVDLITPQYDEEQEYKASSFRAFCATGVTRTACYGTAPVVTGGLAITVVNDSMTFNTTGQFMMVFVYTGTTLTNVDPTFTVPGSISVDDLEDTPMYNAAVTNGTYALRVNVHDAGSVMAINWTPTCASMTQMVVRVAYYAYELGLSKTITYWRTPPHVANTDRKLTYLPPPSELKSTPSDSDNDMFALHNYYQDGDKFVCCHCHTAGPHKTTLCAAAVELYKSADVKDHKNDGRTGGFLGNEMHTLHGNTSVSEGRGKSRRGTRGARGRGGSGKRTPKGEHRHKLATGKASGAKPCKFYGQGTCKRGDKCPFTHDDDFGIETKQPERKHHFDKYSEDPELDFEIGVKVEEVPRDFKALYLMSKEEVKQLTIDLGMPVVNGEAVSPQAYALNLAIARNCTFWEHGRPFPFASRRVLAHIHLSCQPRVIENSVLQSMRSTRSTIGGGEATKYGLSFFTNPAGTGYVGDSNTYHHGAHNRPIAATPIVPGLIVDNAEIRRRTIGISPRTTVAQPPEDLCGLFFGDDDNEPACDLGIVEVYSNVLYVLAPGGQPITDTINARAERVIADARATAYSRVYAKLAGSTNLFEPLLRPQAMRMAAEVIRQKEVERYSEDTSLVPGVIKDAYIAALNEKLHVADSIAVLERPVAWWPARFARQFRARPWATPPREGQAERLKRLERSEPLRTEYDYDFSPLMNLAVFTLGVVMRCIVTPIFEEASKKKLAFGLWQILACTTAVYTADELFGTHITIGCDVDYRYLAIVPCVMFAAIESVGRWSQFLPRLVAHIILAYIPSYDLSVKVHCIWNALNEPFGAPYALHILDTYSRYTTCGAEHIATTDPVLSPNAGLVHVASPHCEPTFGVRCWWGVAQYEPTTYRSCFCNNMWALKERVLKALPRHTDTSLPPLIKRQWRVTSAIFLAWITILLKPIVAPTPYDDWVGRFNGNKLKLLGAVKAAGHGLHGIQPFAKSFVKTCEKATRYTFDIVLKAPRLIQGCPMPFTVYLGPWLHRLAKRFRRRIKPTWDDTDFQAGRHIVYTSGLDASEIGSSFKRAIDLVARNMEFGDHIVFIEDDQSRFDMHIDQEAFSMMDKFYSHYLPRFVATVLRRVGKSLGAIADGTRYWVKYTMQSGWPDTSLTDTVVNVAMKLRIHGIGNRWISLVCGDDSVTVTTYNSILRLGGMEAMKREYYLHGMEVTMKITDNPLLVEFCSGRFYPVRSSYVLMPKIGNLISRIGYDTVNRSPTDQHRWCVSVGNTLAQFGVIDPLCLALSKVMLRLSNGHAALSDEQYDPRGEQQYSYRVTKSQVRPTCDNILAYYETHYQLGSGDIDRMVNTITQSARGQIDDFLLGHVVSCDV
jgi:hypothetical protein